MPSKRRKQKPRTAISLQDRSLDRTDTATASALDGLLDPSRAYSDAVQNVCRQQSLTYNHQSSVPAYASNRRREAIKGTVLNKWPRGQSKADAETNWRRRESEGDVKAGTRMRRDFSSGPRTSLLSETANSHIAPKLSKCSSCHQRFFADDLAKHKHGCHLRPKNSAESGHSAAYHRRQSFTPRIVVEAPRPLSESLSGHTQRIESYSEQGYGGISLGGSFSVESNRTLRPPISSERRLSFPDDLPGYLSRERMSRQRTLSSG